MPAARSTLPDKALKLIETSTFRADAALWIASGKR
jgi:hypothetical protein